MRAYARASPARKAVADGADEFLAGLALSLGCEGGLLFTVAHELLHSTRPLDKALSNVLLCSVGYMHWTCSHLAHHRNVRPFHTPSFPGKARAMNAAQHQPAVRRRVLLSCSGPAATLTVSAM